MLIMILLIALFFVCAFRVKILHEHKYKESIQVINYLCLVISGVAIVIATAMIIKANVFAESSLADKLYERHSIEYGYEQYVFPELAEFKGEKFNADLRAYKRLADSPWTNWFCNKYIAELEPIDLEGKG